MSSMLKTTKKLALNKEQLRVLTDAGLERVAGGYINTTGSQWCSSTMEAKCGGDPLSLSCPSEYCANP